MLREGEYGFPGSWGQGVHACTLLQRQGTTDGTLLPLLSVGLLQVECWEDDKCRRARWYAFCHFLSSQFTSLYSFSLNSQPFPSFSFHIIEENMASWNRQPYETLVRAIFRCRRSLEGLQWLVGVPHCSSRPVTPRDTQLFPFSQILSAWPALNFFLP